jgi:hypothetical protein
MPCCYKPRKTPWNQGTSSKRSKCYMHYKNKGSRLHFKKSFPVTSRLRTWKTIIFIYSVACKTTTKSCLSSCPFFILYKNEFRDLFYSVIKNIRKEFSPWPCSVIHIQAAAYSGSLLLLLLAALSGPIRASFSLQIDKLAYSVCVSLCVCVQLWPIVLEEGISS